MKTIDGDALEKAVASYIYEDAKLSIPQLLKNDDLLMVCEIIGQFPTVDAEPVRHARLVNAHPYGECSCCGELIDVRSGYNYCPNCGARMKE